MKTGDVLGIVGETGNTSGPHVHLEVRTGAGTFFTTRNPELWLSPPQGTGVLAGRLLKGNNEKACGVNIELGLMSGLGNYDVESYARTDVNSDGFYDENLVLGDLAAGDYEIYIDYNGDVYHTLITIQAGLVNFFTYHNGGELVLGYPASNDAEFTPPDFVTPAAVVP